MNNACLEYVYPVNHKQVHEEIFFFVNQKEAAPTFHLNKHLNGWFDLGRRQYGSFFQIPLNILLSKTGIRKKSFSVKNAIWITDHYSANYFHWFNDALPKLIFLEELGIRGEILLPDYLLKFKFIAASLELLKWPYRFLPANAVCRYNTLYLPEVRNGSGAQHPAYTKKLSDNLIQSRPTATRKIFISRKNCPNRNVIPTQPFEDLLRQKGFEILTTEKMSLLQQIELFKECSHLAAVHGAGLTNMLFMKPGSKVLEIRRSDDKLNYCYFKMANVLHHHYYYFLGNAEAIHKSIQDDNLIIDVLEMEKLLNLFLEEE